MRYFCFPENSPCPETPNKMVSSSKGVKVMVCGLDHSGSQPFYSACIYGGTSSNRESLKMRTPQSMHGTSLAFPSAICVLVYFLTPGIRIPCPGIRTPCPGIRTPHPGIGTPRPRIGTHHPGIGTCRPRIGTPHPGIRAPCPGIGTPHPGIGTFFDGPMVSAAVV